MEREDKKDLIPEEEYLKQMGALPKVMAPEDFLQKVHERIERRSAFEKIIRALFVPVKIKVPLEVAAMAATIILIVSTIGIKKPVEQLVYAPKANTGAVVAWKNESAVGSNVAAPAPAAENKPVELALLVRVEEPVAEARGMQRSTLADRLERENPFLEKKALHLEEKAYSAGKPYLTEALSKVKNQVELAHGKVTNVEVNKDTGIPQYVDAEIPAADYAKFVEKLASIGVLQGPILKEAPQGQGIIQVRVRLLTK